MMSVVFMLLLLAVCQIVPAQLVSVFTKDPAAIRVGEEYLRILSISFIGSGVIFVNSSMFQAMGNTIPSLIASTVRITLVAIPAVMLSRMSGFQLHWIWWLSVGTIVVQVAISLLFLKREFDRKLALADRAAAIPEPSIAPVNQPEGIAQAT